MRVLGGAVLWLCLLGQAWALGNQLQSHPSPYLALHGDDPVAWQSWAQMPLKLPDGRTNSSMCQ